MKYLYKNASYEAANRVNYFRSLIKKADFNEFMSSLGEYKNPLIGAGLGLGLGYLLSPEDNKLLGTVGGGLAGGLAGWGYDNWFGGKGSNPNKVIYEHTGDFNPNPSSQEHITKNKDGSYTWFTFGENHNISADDAAYLSSLYPDIWQHPSKYLRPAAGSDYMTDRIAWEGHENGVPNPYAEYYTKHKVPHVILTTTRKLKPEDRLRLFYRGLIIPSEMYTGGIIHGTPSVNSGFDIGATKYIGSLNPELSFLNNPLFLYEPDRSRMNKDNMQKLVALMQKYNLSSFDLGNPYSKKWNDAVAKEFKELGKPYYSNKSL